MDSGYQKHQGPVKGYWLPSSAHSQCCHRGAGVNPIILLCVILYRLDGADGQLLTRSSSHPRLGDQGSCRREGGTCGFAQCAGRCRRSGGRTRSLWTILNNTVLTAILHGHICSRARVFLGIKAEPPLHSSILQLHSHTHQEQSSLRACGRHIRPSALHRACHCHFH